MFIILFEEKRQREKFYPLTFIKPFACLHFGIFSVKEWWGKFTGQNILVDESLPENEEKIFINSHLLPNENIWDEIKNLKQNESLKDSNGNTLAVHTFFGKEIFSNKFSSVISKNKNIFIEYPYQMLQHHAKLIEQQFRFITKGKNSQKISSTNHVAAPENIFLEENVEMEYATLNAREGFIYIGANALVMEGAAIRGSFALGEKSVVKMNAKIYDATSTGKKCTLGGEIKNTIFNHGSNKAHDGYLGDSIVGSWCNFGAGSSVSNIKNTAGEVEVFDYCSKNFLPYGNKFGLLMGDYSRVAINSSINTGSSIGAACNVFGNGLLPKLIPNFSWGTDNTTTIYQFEKAVQHINNWMSLKGEKLSEEELKILWRIFENVNAIKA
jgi:UDP-N-acetylglucosamine diphosphorylase/glucosamine-1-phosphate N-acetyltransferase